jgi:phosphoribosylformylglycinamidine synthase
MASRGATGIEIDLALVPQRETGMSPYEIMLSESQERMLLVAERGREEEVLRVFRKWELDAVVIGRVTSDGILRVLDHGRVAAEIPAHPLAEEGPVYSRPLATPPRPAREESLVAFAPEGTDLTTNLTKLLAAPAIASKRWIVQQYDHMVRTNTVVAPGAGDAALVRVKETGRGLALAVDGNGRWCHLDPRLGAMHAVAEAARNVACVGARPLAATNCLNFGNPEKPEIMWQFSQVIDGLSEACRALAVPITGGNVSFYNETLGRGIYPTPTVGVLGLLDDDSRALRMGFHAAGDAILLLDGAGPATGAATAAEMRHEFSSSEYARTIHAVVAGSPPAIDLAAEKRLMEALAALAAEGVLHSAHDLSDGGLAVALAESGFASFFASESLGADVALEGSEPAEWVLFGERGARAIVTASQSALAAIQRFAAQYELGLRTLGTVAQGTFRIRYNGRDVVSSPVAALCASWSQSLERALAAH